ncbi:MAG: DUF3320 domain-containing protein [Christensenellales bacterium]|jgi:hypothetical protein
MQQVSEIIRIEAVVSPVINYSMHRNRIPVVKRVRITNETAEDILGVNLHVSTQPPFSDTHSTAIARIASGEMMEIAQLPLQVSGQHLANMTEGFPAVMNFTLEREGLVLAREELHVDVNAYDEWPGVLAAPELLAAFVTPNGFQIAQILQIASRIMGDWTGSAALDGYQSGDPNRAKQQAAALYEAVKSLGISYAVSPASFEERGQRIRLCDEIIKDRLAACLDITVLFASCLEAMGLNPLIIIKKGHAFAGLWLEEKTFPEIIQDDVYALKKRTAGGVDLLCAFECTAVTAKDAVSFADAEKMARGYLSDEESFLLALDIIKARASGIKPLPQRIMGKEGWELTGDEQADFSPSMPGAIESVDELVFAEQEKPAKILQWERKLLDLSLRNSLLNLRLTKNVLPILSCDLSALEDALARGEDFTIAQAPSGWEETIAGMSAYELSGLETAKNEILKLELKSRRLRTSLNETELSGIITNLYRNAKASQEEAGANTLYLSMGLLKWYETKGSGRPRYAPLVLLPVDIIRRSAKMGYVLRLRDEEPQMNITLLEMLQQDFSISIENVDPLPLDENGVNMKAVLAQVRRAIMEQSRWDLIESAFLGIFSFSQFVMWNDIRNRSGDLLKNKVVSSLVEGRLTWDARPIEGNGEDLEDGVLLPVSADASQLLAVKAAGEDKSFVLHGPPGTGKSQTITNIIANSLAQGKRVLFVAEKMAALSVVQRRLEMIGIAPFCLELHSNKSRKRDVLEQLRQAAEAAKLVPTEEFEETLKRLKESRVALSGYVKELHARRLCGRSIYELICLYEDVKDAAGSISFTQEFVQSADRGKIALMDEAVIRLAAAAKEAGRLRSHPLSPVKRREYSQQLRLKTPAAISEYQEALPAMGKVSQALCEGLGLPLPIEYDDHKSLFEACLLMAQMEAYQAGWMQCENLSELLQNLLLAARAGIEEAHLKEELLKAWTLDAANLDAKSLLREWNESGGKWALPKMLGAARVMRAVRPFSIEKPQKESIAQNLAMLDEYIQARAEMEERKEGVLPYLEGFVGESGFDWAGLLQRAEGLLQIWAPLREIFPFADGIKKLCMDATVLALNDDYVKSFKRMQAAREGLYGLLMLYPREQGALGGFISRETELCRQITAGLPELREWIFWNAARAGALELGLLPVVKAMENGMTAADVFNAYKKALHFRLIYDAIDDSPELNAFSGALFEERIAKFKELDRRMEEIARREIYCRLAMRIPDFTREAAQSSEVGVLQRAIRSGGRGVSLRRLFDMLPNLLPRLCPCMLMSPLSVAQYIDPSHELFDIVVFDEASQLPTSKAVGAIARGREAIIVGDPNQLPPTSFFMNQYFDEENLESEDLESILDDCLALSAPQTHLLWHYRSRHESLIAFSNSQYYENRLLTFPSPNDSVSKVTLVNPGGHYDRSRTKQNLAEAAAIVIEIVERLSDEKLRKKSIGVVTFSSVQQNLIDDMISRVFAERPDLESIAMDGIEPLFIKNLENVQGDERDVILFSVGYGPDENGKVTLNFGPLNREGGWRRLNVAVSRARHEMKVFSTLRPDQIDLSRTLSQGVAGLRAFLEYAQTGRQPKRDLSGEGEPGIANRICEALSSLGYQTRQSVGRSGYKLDICVVDPARPDEYLLGILLDGSTYSLAKTTRDREVANISVLGGLGWRIHRVWTMDYWDNSAKVISGIVSKIEAAREEKMRQAIKDAANAEEGIKSEEKSPAQEKIAGMPDFLEKWAGESMPAKVEEAMQYSRAQLSSQLLSADEFTLPSNLPMIRAQFQKLIYNEAPIAEDYLIKRALESFGIYRLGSKMRACVNEALAQVNAHVTYDGEVTVYWKRGQIPEDYKDFRAGEREAKDIPPHEAANAALAVLTHQLGLAKGDLARECAKMFGFARLAQQVRLSMEKGIDLAKEQGRLLIDKNDYVTLP